MFPLVNTLYIYVLIKGDNQQTKTYILIDPKSAVESIYQVPRASRAHLEAQCSKLVRSLKSLTGVDEESIYPPR